MFECLLKNARDRVDNSLAFLFFFFPTSKFRVIWFLSMFCRALRWNIFLQQGNLISSSCGDKKNFGPFEVKVKKNSSEIFKKKLDRNMY